MRVMVNRAGFAPRFTQTLHIGLVFALDGGLGADMASYASSAIAVSVDLLTKTASGGDAGGDVFISIEGLTGTGFADQLTGNDPRNLLLGGGNDNDWLYGGAGNDNVSGSKGALRLYGELGRDTLAGGDAADDFVFLTAQEAGIGSARDVMSDFSGGMDDIDVSGFMPAGRLVGAAALTADDFIF